MRTNAIMFLFKSKHYRLHALECFQSFLASTDPHDRAAIAFVAGELQLKSMLPYVLETSLANNHQNSTLLISLLKQDYPDSYKLVADFILNAKTEEDRAMAINQLSAISKMVTRYRVYHQVLIHYPERINELLDYLRLSQRDFDQDRQVIQNEAARLGLDIFQDTSIFIKSAENEKKVA